MERRIGDAAVPKVPMTNLAFNEAMLYRNFAVCCSAGTRNVQPIVIQSDFFPRSRARPCPIRPIFARVTDEVMAQMSKILGLTQLEPLKKTLRSREEIRAYVLKQMDEDKEPEKRYADERMMEKMGLLPRIFPFDSFLVDLLTEQIAGLYDPKAKEFLHCRLDGSERTTSCDGARIDSRPARSALSHRCLARCSKTE